MLLLLSVPILKQLTIAPEVVDSFTALVAAFLIKLTPAPSLLLQLNNVIPSGGGVLALMVVLDGVGKVLSIAFFMRFFLYFILSFQYFFIISHCIWI
jgi:hypothetical protein